MPLNGVVVVASNCFLLFYFLLLLDNNNHGPGKSKRRLFITLYCHYNTQFYYFYSIWFSTRHVTHHVINDSICNVLLQLLRAQKLNTFCDSSPLKHFFLFGKLVGMTNNFDSSWELLHLIVSSAKASQNNFIIESDWILSCNLFWNAISIIYELNDFHANVP